MKKRMLQKSLHDLLKAIDQTVEEHKHRAYKESNIRLERLLDELEA